MKKISLTFYTIWVALNFLSFLSENVKSENLPELIIVRLVVFPFIISIAIIWIKKQFFN